MLVPLSYPLKEHVRGVGLGAGVVVVVVVGGFTATSNEVVVSMLELLDEAPLGCSRVAWLVGTVPGSVEVPISDVTEEEVWTPMLVTGV